MVYDFLFWDKLQVLKKISFLIAFGLLAGCRTTVSTNGGADVSSTEISEVNLGTDGNFRVGVLLPLSGDAARQGNGLKNVTMIALEDVREPNLILQYYDTKGTPEGARVAVANAINQKSKLIIGPLKSSSVEAVAEQAKSHNIPVIAFNTGSNVLQPGIYTLGLMVEEQVDRIISYTAAQGRSRFALLIPDNKTGIAVARAAVKSAAKNGVKITRIGFYTPGTTDFSTVTKQMSDYNTRTGRLQNLKASLKNKAAAGDGSAAKVLERLNKTDTLGEVDFDTVLIPESGAGLKAAVAMFGYYDVYAPQVKFIGTSVWENTRLNTESTLRGAWYPALSRSHSGYFANKYTELFGERPSSLYSMGYDAVALASALSKKSGGDLNETIANSDGYVGINGAFRLLDNGQNQHSLDIVEVRPAGDVIVDDAPKKFNAGDAADMADSFIPEAGYQAPHIFGKDTNTAQTLIYGRPLGLESQPLDYVPGAQEREIVKEGLKKLNIVVPD